MNNYYERIINEFPMRKKSGADLTPSRNIVFDHSSSKSIGKK